MAIAESLLNKLLRLETVQHHQQLEHIRQQINELERQERLVASLEQLARSTDVAGISTGMQVTNTVRFHALLLTMQYSCQRAKAQHATAIKTLSESAAVNMERLRRLRHRLKKNE